MTLNSLLSGGILFKSNALLHQGKDIGCGCNADFRMLHNF